MNSKKNNRLVIILNIITLALIYILYESTKYLMSSFMPGENCGKSIYGSSILDILLNNMQTILIFMNIELSVINIVCGIQNRKNKKIFFWQVVFAIYEMWFAINISKILNQFEIMTYIIKWGNIIIFGIIPIILAIINLVLIRKNKPKIIQIISYILVIILSILDVLSIINIYWNIIAIVMQIIYVHFQEEAVIESSRKKTINLILYYILQSIVTIIFAIMIIYSLLITKINEIKWKKELSILYNDITTLQGASEDKIFIPVEKNYKYGFVDESGKEKIPCEYDRVTFFNEIEINSNTYYIALAKKNNNFYIISKNNDNISISGNLEKYLKNTNNFFEETVTKETDEEKKCTVLYMSSFEYYLMLLTRGKMELNEQVLELQKDNKVELVEKNSQYYYKGKNYSMLISETDDSEEGNSSDITSEGIKCNVIVTKDDGKKESSIVYLTGLSDLDGTLELLTDGYVEFQDIEDSYYGWYDDYGNKVIIKANLNIYDVKDNKIIIANNENNETKNSFTIIDMNGNTLLKTNVIDIYDNIYLIKNQNKKMILLDKNLNIISSEYDKIILNKKIDLSNSFCSYYED